jgi:poly-gamma-glutamate capsule biosynthesis protein CapA/YwtB (metallophosphatase superfamily)
MVARLAYQAVGEHVLSNAQRAERATGAKGWLASLALPARARPVFARAVEATARDPEAIAAALAALAEVAAQWLDEGSLAELRAITATPFVNPG